MNPETIIQRKILIALSGAGCVVWRNETGGFWAGKVVHQAQGQVTLQGARLIPCGLMKGSSDIVGIAPSGQFLAIEVKTQAGKPTKEQLNFIDQVKKAGGIAGVARSPEDALEIMKNG